MKNRLFKQGLISTILGIGIIAVAGYFLNKDMNAGASLTEAAEAVSGWLMAGVMLLRSKDSILGRPINRAVTDATQRDNGVTPH